MADSFQQAKDFMISRIENNKSWKEKKMKKMYRSLKSKYAREMRDLKISAKSHLKQKKKPSESGTESDEQPKIEQIKPK